MLGRRWIESSSCDLVIVSLRTEACRDPDPYIGFMITDGINADVIKWGFCWLL